MSRQPRQKILEWAPLYARLSLDEKLELKGFEKQYVKAYAIR